MNCLLFDRTQPTYPVRQFRRRNRSPNARSAMHPTPVDLLIDLIERRDRVEALCVVPDLVKAFTECVAAPTELMAICSRNPCGLVAVRCSDFERVVAPRHCERASCGGSHFPSASGCPNGLMRPASSIVITNQSSVRIWRVGYMSQKRRPRRTGNKLRIFKAVDIAAKRRARTLLGDRRAYSQHRTQRWYLYGITRLAVKVRPGVRRMYDASSSADRLFVLPTGMSCQSK